MAKDKGFATVEPGEHEYGDLPHARLYPIVDRLEAISELMDQASDSSLELSDSGYRGIGLIISDISAILAEAAGAIESDVIDIKKAGAPAGACKCKTGKGSLGLVGQQAPCRSV